MADLTSKFNQGGLTSTDIEREFHPEFVSKRIILQPKRKKFFSKHSNFEAMMENYGDTLTKIVHTPMIHKDNLSDANIEASTAEIVKNVYRRIDIATGSVVSAFNADNYVDKIALDAAYALVGTDMEDAIEAVYVTARGIAKGLADGTGVGATALPVGEQVFSNAGSILNGASSYGLVAGNLVPLPEEGGVVNLLNATNKLVSAKVTKHGVGMKYTIDSLKKGSLFRTVATHITDVSRAVGDIKEMQSMISCITAASANSIIASDIPSVTDMAAASFVDVVDYDTFTALEQELQKVDCPMDTTIISGSKNIDTVTVQDTYIMYIGRELVPTVRKVTGPDGKIAFNYFNTYASGLDRKKLDGEIGQLGAFTICVDPDLVVFRGAGIENGSATDTANDVAYDAEHTISAVRERANRFTTTIAGAEHYDIFPMIVIGDDSFVETGFNYDTVKAHHIMPKADVYNDMHAEVGGVSAKWSYGFLPYRPERIRMILTVGKRV